MALDQNSAAIISLEIAQDFVESFSKEFPDSPKAFFVGANHVKAILNQEDCIGIRIYNGFNIAENKVNLVLVGVDSNEKDMTSGVIVERLVVCPTVCDSSSALYF